MDTREHNELIKIVYNGSKHLKHVLSSEEIRQMTMVENRFPLTKLPVCGGCERLAMWSVGMTATCRYCGTITKVPMTYSSYLASGYDVDETGHTARKVLKDKDEEIKELILPKYLEIELAKKRGKE